MNHIKEFHFSLTTEARELKNGHKGGVLWFYGLSGSGKSTIANHLQNALFDKNYQVCLLDGDTLRLGLCKDLSFTNEGRTENLRRAAEVSLVLAKQGFIVLSCFITPLNSQRDMISEILDHQMMDVFIKAKLSTCEARDPKKLYAKARQGEIPRFTGIDSPFEEPIHPNLTIDTDVITCSEATKVLLREISKRFG